MRKKIKLKQSAIQLRRKGLSYNEIKKKIRVSKSTLSLWLKEVPLTTEQKKRLYHKQVLILNRGPQSQRERRLREINEIVGKAKTEISLPLTHEAFRLFGAALYWAEGTKTSGFEFTNSDPAIILLMVRWFEQILGVTPTQLKVWLNIYPQQDEKQIKQFWSNLTSIPIENFGKSFVKPLSKNYKKNNLYYGTMKIYIPKGTDMKHRIFGWINAVLEHIQPHIAKVQKEWKSLTEIAKPVNLP